MVRPIVGFVVGALVWMPAFFVLAGLGNFAWPEYGTHAQAWFDQNVFTFPPPMAAYNAVCWAVADVLAGWAAVAVGKRREAAWALAGVIGLYLCSVHLYFYWPNFPWWYNLVVALPAVPAVLLGSMLARPAPRAAVPTAVR